MRHTRTSNRRWLGFRWISVMIALCIVMPTAAAQEETGKTSGKLSTRLAELRKPTIATRSKAQVAQDLSLPTSGAGSLQFSGDAVLTSIRVSDVSASTQAALETAGAKIRHVSTSFGVIDAYVDPANLAAVAGVSAVEYVGEALRPMVRGAQPHAASKATRPATTAATCPTGVVSEGDTQLKAAEARTTYGVTGSGVTVGVVSDSYDQDSSATTNAAADIAAGDLPGAANPCGHTTPVNVLDDTVPTGGDEGRAMLQIVHDLAPDAKLAFASAGNTMYEMADNIRALGNAGADIVTDDIVFYGEPFFQDGPVSLAIRENAAKGIPHFTAAGNANVTDGGGHNITSYEASAYRPMTCPDFKMPDGSNVPAANKPKDCHNFSPSGQDATSTFNLNAGSITMEFQWAEPWFGVTTDLDIFLINNANNRIVAYSNSMNTGDNEVTGTQAPLELMVFNGTGSYSLIIGRHTGSGTPRIKYVLQSADGVTSTEYNASTNSVDTFGPSVGDHVAVAEGLGVAAVPYSNSNSPEYFTSLGPATHYFGPLTYSTSSSDTTTHLVHQAAGALTTPEVLHKPDFAATDGGATSFFAQQVGGVWRFYGTSAAAPHAAGVAALAAEQAAKHNITIGASYIEWLFEKGASPIANGTTADTGAGLVNAVASLALIKDLEPQIYLPLTTR